jgi:hypothetical protein
MRYATAAVTCLLAIAPLTATASPGNVAVARVAGEIVAGRQLYSSTRLLVSWTPSSGDPTHHFEIAAREGVQNTRVRVSAAASATSVTLTGLKSQTTYAVSVIACANDACTQSSASSEVQTETDREHWQLNGSGSSVNTLTKAVSDGNARLSATRFGPDAGAMANRVQLYYGPLNFSRQSALAIATASTEAVASNPDSYVSFTSRAGSTGLISPPTSTPLVSIVATGQAVPVARERGGFVRLFFESEGADGKTRSVSIDSKDGYYGLDFNSGAAATCSTAADYSSGGGCVPTVTIGVAGDANGNSKITNARQHKVGWPTLDSPHWDMSAGTFMVFTSDQVIGCSSYPQNHGYAVWDGSAWKVQYQSNGCPKLFTSVQAAFPFHSGGVKYRLYYGDPSITDGKGSTNLPFLGPKKLIYADGTVSGDAATVDFEDWEAQTSARDVVFLWPNGNQLDARAEGYIDDYHFLTPTGSQDLQVMYITITDGAIAPISVTAILRNP